MLAFGCWHELLLYLIFGYCVAIFSPFAFCPFKKVPQGSLFNDLGEWTAPLCDSLLLLVEESMEKRINRGSFTELR